MARDSDSERNRKEREASWPPDLDILVVLNHSTYLNGTSLRSPTHIFLSSMAAIAIENLSTDIGRIVGQIPSTDTSMTCVSHTSSPLGDVSPLVEDATTTTKKKKKKKSKKSTKSKGEPSVKPLTEDDDEPGPLVLRISRNKHWRYISSYHVCLPT